MSSGINLRTDMGTGMSTGMYMVMGRDKFMDMYADASPAGLTCA